MKGKWRMEKLKGRYLALLKESPYNLVADTDNLEYHWEDSLAPFKEKNFFSPRDLVLDLGSGGGFPVVPLAIFYPQVKFWALESRERKAEFLKFAKSELGLKNLEILWERAEILGKEKEWRQKFDVVISRAFAHLRIFLELAAPFLKVEGRALTYKSSKQKENELLTIEYFLPKIGMELKEILPYSFSYQNLSYDFYLLNFQKIKETSPSFPHSWKKLKNELKKILDSNKPD